MIQDDKPELPTGEEALAHYGVAGMKWGRTRIKANTSEIRSAQRSFQNKRNDLWEAQSAAKKAGPRGSAERAAGQKKAADMKLALLKDPDRVTAAKMTRGEKALLGVLALTGAGAPVAVGALAGSSAVSRRIEYKQDKGAYDKKK